MAETPLYANCTTLVFYTCTSEVLPIKVFHCVNREFRIFIAKIVENINFFIRTAK